MNAARGTRRHSLGLALALLAGGVSSAQAQMWSGDGPLQNGADSREVHALLIDAANGKMYAGTAAGTVYVRSEATLSAPPQAFDDSALTHPAIAVDIAVLANDSDPEDALDATSVEIQADPANGTATVGATGIVRYTPGASYTGTDTFSYTVRDIAGNESNLATVSVRVNAPPTANDDAAGTQEGDPVTIDVLSNDADADGSVDTSSIVIWNSPTNGDATVEPDGRITYVPAPAFSGTDNFTYRVRDNDDVLSNEGTVSVTVDPLPNVAPVAVDDSAGTQQGVAVAVSVLSNDIDADGALDPATVTLQGAPANGAATVAADGTITYAPDAAFSGTDSFSYTVADDAGGVSNAATVTVVVTATSGGNSAPVAADDDATTAQDTPVTISVLSNDSDADGTLDPSTVAVQSAPASGSVAVNADGSITYTPGAGFSGSDTFTYTVADDDGAGSGVATVTVTVTPTGAPNIPPVAMDDTAATSAGTPVIVEVLANDIDDDGTLQPITVTMQSAPASGSVAVNADGSITYTPGAGFAGADSFTYTVVDDDGAASNVATVTIEVAPVDPPPTPDPTPGPRRGGGGSLGVLILMALGSSVVVQRMRRV